MRIGLDIGPVVRPRTGVGHYCSCLLRRLIAQAPDASFAGFSSGLGRPLTEGLSDRMTRLHLRVPTRALYAVWSAAGRPRMDALLGGCDVFHATNYFLPPCRKARRVLSIYDLAFLVAPELASPRIVGPFSRTVPRFAQEADAVVTCSEAAKRDIVALLGVAPEKVAVAPGAADERFTPGDPDAARRRVEELTGVEGPYFLFVGTLEPRKNVPGLIRAFSQAAGNLPHSLLLVGQPGWGRDAVDRAVHEANMGARICRVGYVPGIDALRDCYQGAEALVFPSFYEGFGLPVIEAMACGCPVIAADNSSLPEAGGDAAVYCEANDTEGLAAAMVRVAEDARFRDGMVRRGIEQAERFSWEASAQAVLSIYRRIAGC